jgi:heme-degrading monooxygenase HmoA
MVARIWHGYTTPENAEVYFGRLKSEVLPGIAEMNIPGYKSIQVLRRKLGDEVEFITIMWFDSLENIKSFTGEDYEIAHVPPNARKVLKKFDDRSQHYEVLEEINY